MTEKLLHRRQTTDNALWEIAGEEKLKNWNEENGKKKKCSCENWAIIW